MAGRSVIRYWTRRTLGDPVLLQSLLESANVVSIRAMCGMAGASLLIIALPPRSLDNRLDYTQLIRRLFAGAFLPVFMGPWALAILSKQLPYLILHEYPELIFFTLGSLSYFLFRWLAVWLDQNKDKAINEVDFGRRFEDKSFGTLRPNYKGTERRKRKPIHEDET